MKILFTAISFVVTFSFFSQEIEGKWSIKRIESKLYLLEKVPNEVSFSDVRNKLVLDENKEYILRSYSWKESGLAELSFGFWELKNSELVLKSKFGDVLMYKFKVSDKNELGFYLDLLYAFE